jgi:hypothetical protein
LWRWQHVIAMLACVAALLSAGAVIFLRHTETGAEISGTGNCGAIAVSGTGNTTNTNVTNACK